MAHGAAVRRTVSPTFTSPVRPLLWSSASISGSFATPRIVLLASTDRRGRVVRHDNVTSRSASVGSSVASGCRRLAVRRGSVHDWIAAVAGHRHGGLARGVLLSEQLGPELLRSRPALDTLLP